MSDFLKTARRVIAMEAKALVDLADALDDAFERAVEAMLGVEGRIIVTGIGKSGHVAQKIAATLASTGSPAQFVHPAEASHGDLGMITGADLVLAISNSGEAPELANLIAYAKRFGITLLAITSQAESTLAQHATLVLQIPKAEEACGTGVVPTSSTTMTMALGDALAVAMMEQRSFTAEQFRAFHPGGKLGAMLSQVRDLMHTGEALPLVQSQTPMAEALIEISQKGFGVAGVVDGDSALIGIITDGDLRRHMGDGLLSLTAGDVMTTSPITIAPLALAQDALRQMNGADGARAVTSLFVVDPEQKTATPLGLIHVHDCLRVGLG